MGGWVAVLMDMVRILLILEDVNAGMQRKDRGRSVRCDMKGLCSLFYSKGVRIMCEGLEAWVLEADGGVSAGNVTFDSSGRGATPIGGQHDESFREMGPALGVTHTSRAQQEVVISGAGVFMSEQAPSLHRASAHKSQFSCDMPKLQVL